MEPAAADQHGRLGATVIDAIQLSELRGWTHRYGERGSILTDPDGEEYWAIGEVMLFIGKRPMPGDSPEKSFYEVLPPPDVRIRAEPKKPEHMIKYWKASAIRAWMG